jgi:hypothetical protein
MAQTINLDTSQRVDITCRKGDTFELSLTLKDNASTPASIVNKNDSFKMEVRVSDDSNLAYGDSNNNGDNNDNIILSTLDDTSGATKKIDVKDSSGGALPYSDSSTDVIADGVVKFSVPASIMATRPAGIYVYDIEMTDASDGSKVTTLIYGTFKINEDVSV